MADEDFELVIHAETQVERYLDRLENRVLGQVEHHGHGHLEGAGRERQRTQGVLVGVSASDDGSGDRSGDGSRGITCRSGSRVASGCRGLLSASRTGQGKEGQTN